MISDKKQKALQKSALLIVILMVNLVTIGHALPIDKKENKPKEQLDRLVLNEADACLDICVECLWDDLNKRQDINGAIKTKTCYLCSMFTGNLYVKNYNLKIEFLFKIY